MTSEGVIWACIVVLAIATVQTLAVVVARRLMRDRSARRDEGIRLRMADALLVPNAAPLPGTSIRSTAAIETLLRVLMLVRGSERERVTAAALALGVLPALHAMLKSGSAYRRILAAEGLGFFACAATSGALKSASGDSDSRVRIAALKSLISLGVSLPVTDLLNDASTARLHRQSAAAGVLRNAVAERPHEALAALADPGTRADIRIALIDALAAARVTEAAPALARLTKRGRIDVRAAGLLALARLEHPIVAVVIAQHLCDHDWRIRARAAEAAGQLRLLDLAEPLQALLSDGVCRVRQRAAEALSQLTDENIARLREMAARATVQETVMRSVA